MARRDKRFVRVDVTGAVKEISNVARAADRANSALQIELAEEGRDKMKELIETGGTGVSWERSHYAKDSEKSGRLRGGSSPGRVNTGNMRDSVSVRFEGQGSKKIGAFGWIRNFENYFGYQDNGFYHVLAGRTVEGMHALRDSRRYVVKQVLPKLIQKYQRIISSGRIP